ncbi:uncharacterized protein LOC143916333 [Arctopsyche grandis]|uniref:uncharacterized protein LOC143916333 n=1 Tax=Arctopsyche grandis TaxID=121162 RepID=UPI00406D6345
MSEAASSQSSVLSEQESWMEQSMEESFSELSVNREEFSEASDTKNSPSSSKSSQISLKQEKYGDSSQYKSKHRPPHNSNSCMPINVVMLGMDAPTVGTSREIRKKKDIGKKISKSNINISLSSSKNIPPPEKS